MINSVETNSCLRGRVSYVSLEDSVLERIGEMGKLEIELVSVSSVCWLSRTDLISASNEITGGPEEVEETLERCPSEALLAGEDQMKP